MEEDDAIDEEQQNAVAAVTALIQKRTDRGNEFYDLRSNNGLSHLAYDGAHNHASSAHVPIDFARAVAAVAPGSYGILYIYDEETWAGWQRWVMRRGEVLLESDQSLSPHVGKVGDAP
jgi:hypothetical protein